MSNKFKKSCNRINKSKKGYFFMLDGMVALGILVTGIIIIGSIFVSEPIFKPPYNIGNDLLNIMSRTEMSKLNIGDNPKIQALFSAGKITDGTVSVMDQVGKFYYEHIDGSTISLIDAQDLTTELIENIIPRGYEAQLKIKKNLDEETLFTSYIGENIDDEISNSELVMVTQRLVFGNYDKSTAFGIYIIKLTLWR